MSATASGSQPYVVRVDLRTQPPSCTCDCPSGRANPDRVCKHSLGLLLWRCEQICGVSGTEQGAQGHLSCLQAVQDVHPHRSQFMRSNGLRNRASRPSCDSAVHRSPRAAAAAAVTSTGTKTEAPQLPHQTNTHVRAVRWSICTWGLGANVQLLSVSHLGVVWSRPSAAGTGSATASAAETASASKPKQAAGRQAPTAAAPSRRRPLAPKPRGKAAQAPSEDAARCATALWKARQR